MIEEVVPADAVRFFALKQRDQQVFDIIGDFVSVVIEDQVAT